MTMRSTCVIVPKQEGERVRKKLSELGFIRLECLIRTDREYIYIPVTPAPDQIRKTDIGPGEKFEVAIQEFEVRELRPDSYKDLLRDLPAQVFDLLPTSYDIIGDLAIIKLEDEITSYAPAIANALIETNPSLRTVALDHGVVGSYRVRDLEVITGGPTTETVHVEFGLRFHVNPSRAYFSPRLANERARVASLVRPGEKVIDMFAGVGPFSIMMARNSPEPGPERIWAIELNPEAMAYLRKNLEVNKVADRVVPLEGDARERLQGLPSADRIVMNLPHDSSSFLGLAVQAAAPGATIHFYEIHEKGMNRATRFKEVASGMPLELASHRTVHSYTPAREVVCLDIRKNE